MIVSDLSQQVPRTAIRVVTITGKDVPGITLHLAETKERDKTKVTYALKDVATDENGRVDLDVVSDTWVCPEAHGYTFKPARILITKDKVPATITILAVPQIVAVPEAVSRTIVLGFGGTAALIGYLLPDNEFPRLRRFMMITGGIVMGKTLLNWILSR